MPLAGCGLLSFAALLAAFPLIIITTYGSPDWRGWYALVVLLGLLGVLLIVGGRPGRVRSLLRGGLLVLAGGAIFVLGGGRSVSTAWDLIVALAFPALAILLATLGVWQLVLGFARPRVTEQ